MPRFPAVRTMDDYKRAIQRRDKATTKGDEAKYQREADRLNRAWMEYNGGDKQELYEICFGG